MDRDRDVLNAHGVLPQVLDRLFELGRGGKSNLQRTFRGICCHPARHQDRYGKVINITRSIRRALPGLAQLVLHVNVTGCNEGVDTWELGALDPARPSDNFHTRRNSNGSMTHLHCLSTPSDVAFSRTCKPTDDRWVLIVSNLYRTVYHSPTGTEKHKLRPHHVGDLLHSNEVIV
eukprot:747680-Hanusia_phi.AAC.3